jgi:hypothetical protein
MLSKMNQHYTAKRNQVTMMEHRGYSDDTVFTAMVDQNTGKTIMKEITFEESIPGGEGVVQVEGKRPILTPTSDRASIISEQAFNDVYNGVSENLNTYNFVEVRGKKSLVINYWIIPVGSGDISLSEANKVIELYKDISNGMFYDVYEINIFCNSSFTSQANSVLKTSIGTRMTLFSYLDLRPLTFVQLPKYRKLTPEELKAFPFEPKNIPKTYELFYPIKYNGWRPGTIIIGQFKTPKHNSMIDVEYKYFYILRGGPPAPKLSTTKYK